MQNQQKTVQSKTEWSDQDNLHQAQKLKQLGNQFFSKKQYKNALKKYHQAILHLGGIIDKKSSMAMYAKTAKQQTSSAANALKFSIWLNMSQIYLYQQKYQKGLEILKKSQELSSSKNLSSEIIKKSFPKLLYRKGICLMKMNYFQEARIQFFKLKELDQSFANEIDNFQKQIKEREKIAQNKSKKFYQGFFK